MLVSFSAKTQPCVPDHFFHRFAGNAATYTSSVITTPQNETIIAGSALHFNGPFLDATDGWITKLSARGTVLWAKRYYLPGFNSGGFSCIQNATDSTYLVTGRFGLYRRAAGGLLEELNASTFLMHLDKFGNLIWLKRMTNFITNSNLTGITKVANNSFIINGNIYSNGTSRLLVIKTDLSGNVPWYKVVHLDSTQLYRTNLKLLNNGELLLVGPTFRANSNFSQISNQGYYFLKMDAATGDLLTNKAIYINQTPGPDFIPVFDIENIQQTGDSLYLYTSFSERTPFNPVPYAKEAAIIKTSTSGKVYSVIGFYNTAPGCILIDGKYNGDGTHTLLLDDGYKTIRTVVANDGNIINEHAYTLVNGNYKGLKLLDRQPANRILFAGRTQVPFLGLMKTESDGSIPCMEGLLQMVSVDATSFFTAANFSAVFFNTNPVLFEQFDGGIGKKDYSFNKTTDCIVTCCDNIKSDTSFTELCDALRFRLPDNSTVRESGLYYTHHTTANNCDSIAYHDVRFLTKPVVNLGQDLCMGDSLQIKIQTDSGYAQYNWMGALSPNHTYIVRGPGIYTVSVSNKCGTHNDQIEVFKECDFPVFIPSAFTPNNDGLNDRFGYPLQNKNRFISMSIFNRWGQLLFYSKKPEQGWDGTFKGAIQPNDSYVYLFHLSTLDGRTIEQKGIINLIR